MVCDVAKKLIDFAYLVGYIAHMAPKDAGACHVAEIVRRHGTRTYSSFLLRRTYREGGKVKHQTLGNISHLARPTIELIRRILRGDLLVDPDDAFDIVRSRPHGHVAAVLGVLRATGLERIIDRRKSRERDLVIAMLVARIIDPRSKLATARGLDRETLSSSLGEGLGVADADVDELYAAMDWLLQRQTRIETTLAKRHLTNDIFVLYDVSSTYFEGRCCPLAKLGHSRDGKKNKLQIIFGLLCDAEGRPVSVEVFEGNTGDPKTVPAQVKKMRERFDLKHIVLIGDRGMITEARIREDLAPVECVAWITALRAPAIRRLVNTGTLQLSLFDETKLAEISSPDYPGERLVVCRNPLLAADRTRKRQELLAATELDLEKIVAATKRTRRPLRGKDAIGVRVGRVINRHKMAKHFRIKITSRRLTFERKTEAIQKEADLDGFYVVRTSVPEEVMAPGQVVAAYKSLSRVERAFRSYKTVDLKVRPIHHRNENRVRAHVFLCMLAYYVEWHMRELLAPILFDDEYPEKAERRRPSIVDPAKRSLNAERKAATKRTDDDFPVHSFQSLLADLATITKNRIRLKTEGEREFDQLTTPTPLQQRVFDLLKVPCRV